VIFDELSFGGEWRRYQRLALDAFERDRKAGRRRTHIVAPPGSGKTLLGVELVRRVGRRALVLAPNSAVQAQWLRTVRQFTREPSDAPRFAGAHPAAPLACLTYQALCQLEDPEIALGRVAVARWEDDRAEATGTDVEAVRREAQGYTGAAAERRREQIGRITASVKREIARGEHAGVTVGELLSASARARVEHLRAAGVGTVVLDECHHLASLWGYVVRAVLDELGDDVHVIGLTATPPGELPGAEADLYAALLGPVDFTVPTPAVVRDGFLAPYQELAWLTEPLPAEREWLAEHDTRFRELVTALHEDAESSLSFPRWVIARMRDRRRSADDDAELSWPDFQRARPALARAGIRFLASAGLALPPDAPHGEGYRRPPDLDDWLVLLEDYALRCLYASDAREAAERASAVSAALRDLGFQLTRRGIRRGRSEVDRLLTGSQAKTVGLVEVLGFEMEARGERSGDERAARGRTLRGLVLCDAEVAEPRPDDALTGVLDPAAGTARHAVLALAGDVRTTPLRPLLVSGRGLRCAPADADVLIEALAAAAADRYQLPGWEAEADGLLCSLRSSGAEWVPRAWVDLATQLLVDGVTGVLIGTRALLGEGWDCPPVNCLVDLTVAATGVSVQQMRGRSLRLDPGDPAKLASNWDIVCVAPDLVRGSADYERFVRKHRHLFAPAEDGAIEAGPTHVHPELSPYGPPAPGAFGTINASMVERAGARDAARERWRIGTAYRGAELRTLVARRRADAAPSPAPVSTPPGAPSLSQRLPLSAGLGGGAAFAVAGVAASAPPLLAGVALAPLGLGWAAVRLRSARSRLPVVLPLDRAVRAIADAYVSLGELSAEGAATVEFEPRASGWLRVSLPAAGPEESTLVARALDELIGVADAPRYLIGRPLAEPGVGAGALLGRVLRRRPPFPSRLHPVPSDLGRNKERAEAFARAWARWVGPGELIFAQRTEEGREARARAAAEDGGWETVMRDVWV
jgi:superfamily II DNA or RNA helicase